MLASRLASAAKCAIASFARSPPLLRPGLLGCAAALRESISIAAEGGSGEDAGDEGPDGGGVDERAGRGGSAAAGGTDCALGTALAVGAGLTEAG